MGKHSRPTPRSGIINVLFFLRRSAETAKINLMVCPIHVVRVVELKQTSCSITVLRTGTGGDLIKLSHSLISTSYCSKKYKNDFDT